MRNIYIESLHSLDYVMAYFYIVRTRYNSQIEWYSGKLLFDN